MAAGAGLSCTHHILLGDLLPLSSMRRGSEHVMHCSYCQGQEEECSKKVFFKEIDLKVKPNKGHIQEDCSKSLIGCCSKDVKTILFYSISKLGC